MSFRTNVWGKIGVGAAQDARKSFEKLPPLAPAEPVGLVPLEKAWGIPGTNVLIANDLPSSVLPMSERIKQGVLRVLLNVFPNTEAKTRWDRETATKHLMDFMDNAMQVKLWDDWATDAGWARTFTQGPCAGDLHKEGDVWVVDTSILKQAEMRPGNARLGVKVALHIDENGARPAYIEKEDGTRVTPDQGAKWEAAKIIAGAGVQTYIGVLRHVLNLHYIGAQGMAVLVHNHLPFEHPLHRLLWPHVANTLRVNWTASYNFVGPELLVVTNYAPSWKGFQTLVAAGWGAFKWEDYDIPDVYERRGTSELIAKGWYPFGEDATLIWKTIYDYVTDYISQYYADDAALQNDKVVQDAFKALDAVLPQPLRAGTRKELAQNLTRFISMVSIEHKLVSGIAFDFFCNPYYFPTLATDAETPEEAVPFREQAEANVMFRAAISAMAYPLLGDWSYVYLDDKGKGAMKRFHEALRAAGKEIDARNAKRKVPFPYLHPDVLETSVAV